MIVLLMEKVLSRYTIVLCSHDFTRFFNSLLIRICAVCPADWAVIMLIQNNSSRALDKLMLTIPGFIVGNAQLGC